MVVLLLSLTNARGMLGHLAAIDERAPEDPFIMTSFFNISAATFWVSQKKPPRFVVTIEMYPFSVLDEGLSNRNTRVVDKGVDAPKMSEA